MNALRAVRLLAAGAGISLVAACHNPGIECTDGLPPFPDAYGVPAGDALTASPAGDTSIAILREYVSIELKPGTTCEQFKRLLAKHRVRVVGGHALLKRYYVRMRDPGPRWEAVQKAIARIQDEPVVNFAFTIYVRGSPQLRPAKSR